MRGQKRIVTKAKTNLLKVVREIIRVDCELLKDEFQRDSYYIVTHGLRAGQEVHPGGVRLVPDRPRLLDISRRHLDFPRAEGGTAAARGQAPGRYPIYFRAFRSRVNRAFSCRAFRASRRVPL